MSSLVFVKPAPGLALRAPDGTPIPAGGMPLPKADLYVQRRLAEGDLVEAEEAPAEPEAPAAETTPAARPRKEVR